MRVPGKRNKVLVIRWAFRALIGPLEDSQVVRHACDTPQCCNPGHWIAGSQAQNVKDMDDRGRRVTSPRVGVENGRAMLTDEQVREIRRRKADGALLRELAPDYGVSMRMISMIVRRERWTHVE